ncbi:MAG: DUF502 domain-containing protein [Planctomycetota bacterium]|jgi:uncharacterized membrane protein
MSIGKRVKSYFLRGLAVLLPAIVTIWILVGGYRFIQRNISYYINQGLVWLIMQIPFLMNSWSEEKLTKFWVDGAGSVAGFIIALIAVFIVGALLASVVGRTLWRMIEGFIVNTPLLRRIYPYVKQITDFVLTQDEQKQLFSRVVAIEWPRKGVWSVGFVTGSGLKKVVGNMEKEFLTILIPNTPMPVTGYVMMVPKEETIALDVTVEEAFRFAISAGVITPVGEQIPALPKADSEDNK